MTCEMTIEIEEEKICINWLMYKSYEAQRDNFPTLAPRRWRKVYLNQKTYEKIYKKMRKK